VGYPGFKEYHINRYGGAPEEFLCFTEEQTKEFYKRVRSGYKGVISNFEIAAPEVEIPSSVATDTVTTKQEVTDLELEECVSVTPSAVNININITLNMDDRFRELLLKILSK
jgi:hypothetical protein